MRLNSHIFVMLSAWVVLAHAVSCVQKAKDSERASFASTGENSETSGTDDAASPTTTDGVEVPLFTVSTPSTVADDLTLNWTTPTDEATYSYVAKLCRESDCTTNCLPEVEAGSAFTTTFTGLIKGRSYYGCVFGRGSDGEATETFVTATAIVIDKTIPTDIVIALPDNYNSTGSVSVGWTGGTDENFAHFNAKACESNDCATDCLDALTISTTNTEFTGLVNHKSYYYCVQSVDKAGHETIFFPSSYPTKINTVTIGAIADRVIETQNAVTGGVTMIEIDSVNSDSGTDTDVTYECVYDILVDGGVTSSTPCTELSGTATFTADTGTFNWTPSVDSNTTYEIKIKGTHSTGVFDEEIFVIQIIQNITTTDLLQYFEAAYGNGTALPSNPESTWLDLSGNKRNASIVGNAANGWTGSGSRSKPYRLYLDGNSRIDLGPFVATGGSFWLDTWIRPLAAEVLNRTIISTGADIGNGFALKQSAKNANRIQLIIGNYDDLILSNQGPYGYYKLDETDGTAIVDTANARNLAFGSGGSIAGSGATAGIDSGGIAAGVISGDIGNFNLMGLSFLVKFSSDIDGSFTRAESLFSSAVGGNNFVIRMDVDEANCTGEILSILNLGDATKVTCVTTQTLTKDQWHHMGIRWDGAKYKVFVDGVEWATAAGPGGHAAMAAITEPIYLGSIVSNTAALSGALDNVAIWSSSISDFDLTSQNKRFQGCESTSIIASNQIHHVGVHYDGSDAKLFIDGTEECSFSETASATTANTNLFFGAHDTGDQSWQGEVFSLRLYDSGSTAKITDNYNGSKKLLQANKPKSELAEGLVMYFDPALAEDGLNGFNPLTCGNGNYFELISGTDMSLVNFASCSVTSGWTGSSDPNDPFSLVFDSTNDKVQTTFDQDLSTAVTIEAWAKLTASVTGSTKDYPIATNDNGLGSGYNLHILWVNDGNILLRCTLPTGAGSNYDLDWSIGSGDDASAVKDAWHHYACVASGSNAYLYLDGVLKASATAVGPFYYHSAGQPWSIGAPSGASYFKGAIGPVRIYDRALPVEDIYQNCNAEKPRFSGSSCLQ